MDPERNIIITPGSDAGLMFAMMPFIDPGDEVMVPDPQLSKQLPERQNPRRCNGAGPLREENGYQLEIEEFEKRLTPNTKMIVLTNPNNPTTTVMRRESLEKLAQFAVKNDLIVVCDQAFEDSVYDGVEFVTLASLPGMWERTVTVCSISKGMALSGYRVAYIVADDHIMDVYYGSAVSVIGATNTASQLGAIAALKDASFLEEYNRIFDRRRKIVYEIFNSIPGVSMAMPESTFLCWVNVSRLGTADEVNAYIIKRGQRGGERRHPVRRTKGGHLRIVFGAFREEAQMVAALERVKAALMKLGKEKGVSEQWKRERDIRLSSGADSGGPLYPCLFSWYSVWSILWASRSFDMNALAVGGFLGLLIGALFCKTYGAYWDAVLRGIGSSTSVSIVVILLVIGMFTKLMAISGVSQGFVWMAHMVGMPGSIFTAFTFLAACLITTATGSSIGTLTTVFPSCIRGNPAGQPPRNPGGRDPLRCNFRR